MTAGPSPIACLTTSEGHLVSVQVTVEPRLLEDLLDALSSLSFPINPEIYHDVPGEPRGTLVEFPAYSGRLEEVYSSLSDCGLTGVRVRVENMLEHIQT